MGVAAFVAAGDRPERAIVLPVGAACALILGIAVFCTTSVWQDMRPAAVPQQEKPSNIEPPKGSLPLTEAPAAVPGEASAPEGAPSKVGAPDSTVNCEQQAWPYVDQQCRGAQPDQGTRTVRVISTDRTAPSTLVTAAPLHPGTVRRTTDGFSDGQASAMLLDPVLAPPPTTPDQPSSRGSSWRKNTTSAALDPDIPGETAADDEYHGHRPGRASTLPRDDRVRVDRKPIHRKSIREAGDRTPKTANPPSGSAFSYNPGATGH